MTDILYWIWFSLRYGEKYSAAEKLLASYGDPKSIYYAARNGEQDISPIESPDFFSLEEAKDIADFCHNRNITIIPLSSEYYPHPLMKIKDRPILLYARGIVPDFRRRLCVAMVGTRRISDYGERAAYAISYDLSRTGAIIISGLAKGVDSVAHRACLDSGGTTVAVLGCGVDRAYPSENRYLMDEIAERGCVISEYKPMSSPEAYHFPRRNRIISGLSSGTVVVEADTKSGAMITARNAVFQGRDVFAVPGMIGESNSSGTNLLLKQGAKAITCADDVIEVYSGTYGAVLNLDYLLNPVRANQAINGSERDASITHAKGVWTQRSKAKAEPVKIRLSDSLVKNEQPTEAKKAEKKILENIPEEKKPEKKVLKNIPEGNQGIVYSAVPEEGEISIDEIASKTSLPMNSIMASITMLEINGLCERVAGGRIRRL